MCFRCFPLRVGIQVIAGVYLFLSIIQLLSVLDSINSKKNLLGAISAAINAGMCIAIAALASRGKYHVHTTESSAHAELSSVWFGPNYK